MQIQVLVVAFEAVKPWPRREIPIRTSLPSSHLGYYITLGQGQASRMCVLARETTGPCHQSGVL